MMFRFSFFLLLVLAYVFSNCSLAQVSYNLSMALKTARASNPDLKTQHFSINIAEGDVTVSRMRPNPIFNTQDLQLTQPSKYYPGSDCRKSVTRQTWWQLTKPIQLPATRRYRINTALQNKVFVEKSFAEIERSLFQEVALKWLDVWAAQTKLKYLLLSKANADSLLKVNEIRYKNQSITQTDLMRAQVYSGQFSLQIKTAQRTFQNEARNLQFLLGEAQPITVDTSENFLLNEQLTLDTLMQLAQKNRSDIAALTANVEFNRANIRLQKALAYPNPELGMIYNPQNTVPYVGFYGTIQLPVFSRNQGEIQKSLKMTDQAEQGLGAARLLLESELPVAFSTYKVQEENLKSYTSLLATSQQVLNNVRYAYLRGGTNIIDYLEAQRSWVDTQQQYYDALLLLRQSYIQVLYASGLINQIAQ